MIDFIGKKHLWFILSGILIFIGIASMTLNGIQRGAIMNFGIDFTGGTILMFKYETVPQLAEVRSRLQEFKLQRAELQVVGEKDLSVRSEPLETAVRGQVVNAMLALGKGAELLEADTIGPVIGGELRNQAILALLAATILMTVYITLRFRFDYAIAAILALYHDAIITTGIIALLWRSIDAPFIAAILTILGYSINDTIIIFDRVREDLAKPGAGKRPFNDVMNEAINQTLPRSINTVLTVLVMNAAIFIFGGVTIKDFALTLLIGFSLGAYSSIFVAPPLLTFWHRGK